MISAFELGYRMAKSAEDPAPGGTAPTPLTTPITPPQMSAENSKQQSGWLTGALGAEANIRKFKVPPPPPANPLKAAR